MASPLLQRNQRELELQRPLQGALCAFLTSTLNTYDDVTTRGVGKKIFAWEGLTVAQIETEV